jgi:hypothetical protein
VLVENTQPCHRAVGDIYLAPGCNKVDAKKWDHLLENGYKKPVAGLIDEGILIMHEGSKPTIALVSSTYDVDLLEDWLSDAKGPLKGAIKKQLSKLTISDEKAS